MKVTRSYKLKLDSNQGKLEDIKYSANSYTKFLKHFTTQLYFNPQLKYYSTKNLGTFANQAQKKAIDLLKAHREAARETGNKSNCPQIKYQVCPGTIKESKDSSFDYWINVTSQFKNRVKVPVNSFSKVNEKLRNNWKLAPYCELFQAKNGIWFARVFVTKEVVKPDKKKKSLGVDVGIVHGATRSDKYLGRGLRKLILQEKKSQASRQRNQIKKKSDLKTKIKQQLDIEVTRSLRRSKKLDTNLAVEHPKRLANLRTGRLQGWARSYFSNRLTERAIEEGVYLIYVNPAYTSITCSQCLKVDKKSRVKRGTFKCTSCGNTVHADINAACNIARIGQDRLVKVVKTPVRTILTA